MNYWRLSYRVDRLRRSSDPRQRKRGLRLQQQLNRRQLQELNRACHQFNAALDDVLVPAINRAAQAMAAVRWPK